ncbi:hypothetical protein PO587_38870 [Streptomyces gilvifuscus]|uniref:Uncharacterized protein n=1 Tax=Streptomyces gilvifuscus TaxID=1550617 RepID=A0ABT5G6I1_9ACTN|nr:hypothetical protein [Streptomyces gilvifuscus]MDC2960404.1 hypothetical protein [Streptomyces gilvifuscus]
MPPDRIFVSGRPLDLNWPKRFDRNIPQWAAVETRDLRDREVNMQVGAFIAAPVLGVVLVLRPDVYEPAAAAVCMLLAAARRSHLRYRRLRIA